MMTGIGDLEEEAKISGSGVADAEREGATSMVSSGGRRVAWLMSNDGVELGTAGLLLNELDALPLLVAVAVRVDVLLDVLVDVAVAVVDGVGLGVMLGNALLDRELEGELVEVPDPDGLLVASLLSDAELDCVLEGELEGSGVDGFEEGMDEELAEALLEGVGVVDAVCEVEEEREGLPTNTDEE